MIDLTAISPELIVARGQYATVRAAHEDMKKAIVTRCGVIMTMTQRITQLSQPDNDKSIDAQALDGCMFALDDAIKALDLQCDQLCELEAQRKTLKELAWPKERK